MVHIILDSREAKNAIQPSANKLRPGSLNFCGWLCENINMLKTLMRKFFGADNNLAVGNAQIPDDQRVYAIGDIHGRLDLLQQLLDLITDDANGLDNYIRKSIVYLGDYIDRGFQSREVIDFLLDRPLEGFDSHYLKGNHEDQLLDFMDDPRAGESWMRYGGDATLYSYGIQLPEGRSSEEKLELIQSKFKDAFPARHLKFISNLKLACNFGDYMFVHAGVNPFEPLSEQKAADLLWIRDDFLDCDSNFGKVIVHGHSIFDTPIVRENRIGIDTGAYASNKLTCVVLEGSEYRFLST